MFLLDLPQLNLSDVAARHGYQTFYKLLEVSLWNCSLKESVTRFLFSVVCSFRSSASCSHVFRAPLWMLLLMNCALMFQDSGVMDLVNDVIYQPVTVFLPSDGIMASLPQEQKDFLFHKDNRPQLVEYLKYHILQSQKVRKTQIMTRLNSF